MAHTFHSDELDSAQSALGEDVNPAAYLVNLADCMLVLACGFLVSLIVAGSGIADDLEFLSEGDLAPIEPESTELAEDGAGAGYKNVGEVYLDPSTGNYYLLEREER